MHYVYILASASSGKFYIGQSKNPGERLLRHNHGREKSTKPYRPWNLLYVSNPLSPSDVFDLEFFNDSQLTLIW